MRFTALLTLYEGEESAARQRLGILERDRSALVSAIRGLEAERDRAAIGVGLADREWYLGFHLAITRRIAEAEAGLARHDQAIEAARAALAEAHRRTTTMAKLRERDAREARRLADRREQRRSDERAAARHVLHDREG